MIEGLKISVPSDELRSHLEERAGHHAEKAGWYRGQVENLMDGGMRPESVTNDPINSLERSMQQHKAKASYFTFLADHIILNEDYLLTERELEAVEIFSRYG